VIFGCEQLGGYDWGDVDERAVEHAIRRAAEMGVRTFDTADCYGRGRSERRLGEILRRISQKCRIITKGGVIPTKRGVAYDSSPTYLARALEGSLRNLGVERIHCYQLHHWDGRTPFRAIFEFMEEAVADGKIGAYGISNFGDRLPGPVLEGYPHLKYISFQFNLLDRDHAPLIETCSSMNIEIFIYGILAQGLLSGKYGGGTRFPHNDRRSKEKYVNFHGSRLIENLEKIKVFRENLSPDLSLSRYALQWVLGQGPHVRAIVGVKRFEQLEELVG